MMEISNMFEIVLFDLDGTLTDPKAGITKSVQYALKKFGIEEDADNLTLFIGPPLIESFMEFYNFSIDDARKGVTYYREYYAPTGKFENEIYEGIPEMLKELKKKGIKLGVASSKPEPFAIDILKYFDIFDYFDVITGSLLDETRTTKEEVLEETLRRFDLDFYSKKDNVAMVGDRKYDIKGAKAFGLAPVAVSYGYAEAGELEAEEPASIARTVEELKEYLLK